MVDAFTLLDTKELILVLVAAIGLVPVLLHYREQSKWFAVGYGLLFVGAIATNVEVFAFEPFFDAIEHGVGLMGSGVAFLVAAYLRRQAVITDGEDDGAAGLVEGLVR